ncbi:MAG: ATP-dependent DNA helicase RecG [Sulfuricellaceae bacterium]
MDLKIGKATQEKLAKLGIRHAFDLLLHLPLRYEDETHLYPIADAPFGQTVQVEGCIVHAEVQYRPRKALICQVQDGGGQMFARFLHFYPSQVKALAEGKTVRLLGELRQGFYGVEMVHPKFSAGGDGAPLNEALTPVYPTTAGLSQESLRKLINQSLQSQELTDTLPEALRDSLSLADFAASIRALHQPPPDVSLAALTERDHPAWRRLAFDELLAQQLSMRQHYRRRRNVGAPVLAAPGALTEAFLAGLPFALTQAQHRVAAEISRDLAQPHPMQRLLQGDVGSGKTVVAALAALQAIEHGYQAALMAPTELLAEQHYLKLMMWLEPLGVNTAWLAARLKAKEKRAALEAASNGGAQLIVGTHALFQEQVEFGNLGLAVVDEQHRFGVHQRLALRNKGRELAPHQLMMSATPIPRTLSMSYYADLDVSVIDELPPGRTPVLTRLVSDARRDEVVTRVREACLKGRQAYWVCPLIEESEALQLKTAVETFETLTAAFPELNIGLVHGRMRSDEKAQAMADFKAGVTHLLVATTVIEVGVDVPNASLMVIEHAERMGLSQLHQLRGRVGRGATSSVCLLLYQQPLSELARERLKIVHDSNDGFEIARRDLQLRGPGEFLGAKQSGVPMLKVADLERDQDLLEMARDVAQVLLRDYPEHAARHLKRWLGGRQEYLKV